MGAVNRVTEIVTATNVGRTYHSAEEYYIILYNCEAVTNSRPITYVSEESEDLTPLAPGLFLSELPNNGVPDLDKADILSLNR